MNTTSIVWPLHVLTLLCIPAMLACSVPKRAWSRRRRSLMAQTWRYQRSLFAVAGIGFVVLLLLALGNALDGGRAFVALVLVAAVCGHVAFTRWELTNGSRSPLVVMLELTKAVDRENATVADVDAEAAKVCKGLKKLPRKLRDQLLKLNDKELRVALCEEIARLALWSNADETTTVRTDAVGAGQIYDALVAVAEAPPAVRRRALEML